jgi:hypothetical protein
LRQSSRFPSIMELGCVLGRIMSGMEMFSS